MLKPSIDSLDQVLPDVRRHYVSDGDTFVLQLDGDPTGFVSRSTHADTVNKVAEFRDHNIELEQALVKSKDTLRRFESIDPEEEGHQKRCRRRLRRIVGAPKF